MQEEKYFLTLRIQKGQEAKIDISSLAKAKGFFSTNLEEIDNFTLNFTYDELIEEIDEANIADAYLEGTLCITDNQNHRPLKVLTKDYVQNFNLYTFINDHLNDKKIMNNIVNKFHNFSKMATYEEFKKAINEGNIKVIFELLNDLDYLNRRKLLCYLIDAA